MTGTIIIAIVITVITLVLTTVVIIYAIRKTTSYNDDILRKLPTLTGEGKVFRSKNIYSARYGNVEYTCAYIPGSRNAPPALVISIKCASNSYFGIKTETGFDKFAKNAGISKEIETGDPEFDDTFYIDTNSIESVQSYLSDSKIRQAVKDIFNSGFISIKHNGRLIEATLAPLNTGKLSNKNIVVETIDILNILAVRLKYVQQDTIPTRRIGINIIKIIIFTVLIVLNIAGIVFLRLGIVKFTPLDKLSIVLDSLKYSTMAMAVFLLAAVLLLRGRSSSHRLLLTILALSLAAFPLSGMAMEMFLNGYLDNSESVSHSTSISKKYFHNTRSGTNYYVKAVSWRADKMVENIRISRDVYDKIVPGESRVKVTTRRGKYHFEWVVSYELE